MFPFATQFVYLCACVYFSKILPELSLIMAKGLPQILKLDNGF